MKTIKVERTRDMSPQAIRRRLMDLNELWRMCVVLERSKKVSDPSAGFAKDDPSIVDDGRLNNRLEPPTSISGPGNEKA
jgi:hypothetical protein